MFTLENYSEKSFVVRSTEGKIDQETFDQLSQRGRWNPNLRGGPGFIFSNRHRETMEAFVRERNEVPREEKEEPNYETFRRLFEYRMRREDPNMPLNKICKMAGKRWREMTATQRAEFIQNEPEPEPVDVKSDSEPEPEPVDVKSDSEPEPEPVDVSEAESVPEPVRFQPVVKLRTRALETEMVALRKTIMVCTVMILVAIFLQHRI